MRELSRRRVLASVASAVGVGITGCLSGDSTDLRYQLSANNVPGSLTEHFRWNPRGPFADTARDRMDQLIADGSLTTAGYTLSGLLYEGPRYVEHDGSYYEVSQQRTGRVEREHWIFWFDLIEGEPPSDADVFRSGLGTGSGTNLEAEYDLSRLDVRVVETATGEVYREGPPLHDPEDTPSGRRGHVFLHRDPDETALLPDPPFTHVAFETNDRTRYARAVAERATVELQQYRYTAEQIATSADGYADYVHDQFLETTFDSQRLSGGQREILDTITAGGRRYDEHPPLSEAMAAVLDRLGLAGIETPDPKSTAFSEDVYFRYQEGYYSAQLEVFR